MGRVCELVLVMMVTGLSHHLAAAAHPFLRDECLVMKSQEFSKFSTFDENIILHLAARSSATSPTVTLKQGSYEIKLKLEDMNHWIWYNLVLNLGGENPECFLNNKQIVCAMEDTTNLMTEMKWEVEIKGAISYVGCPEEMPVFIMEESDEIIQIPRSGNEEVLMVFPTENISIDVSVGEKKKLVCWEEGKVVLMNDGTSCQPLPKYTGQHNAQIIIKDKDFTTEEGDNGDNILKLWQVNLTGVLYIVQCTKGCHVPGKDITTTTTSITPTSQEEESDVVVAFPAGGRVNILVVVIIAVVVLVILAAAFIFYVFSLQGGKSNPIPCQPNPVPAERPLGAGALSRAPRWVRGQSTTSTRR